MKITRDEKARRRAWVEEALVVYMPLSLLYAEFRAKFGVGRRAAERYVREVYEAWEREGRTATDRAAKRAEIERRADYTFRVASLKADPRGMAQALKLKADLHGLGTDDPRKPAGGAALSPGDAAFDALMVEKWGHARQGAQLDPPPADEGADGRKPVP